MHHIFLIFYMVLMILMMVRGWFTSRKKLIEQTQAKYEDDKELKKFLDFGLILTIFFFILTLFVLGRIGITIGTLPGEVAVIVLFLIELVQFHFDLKPYSPEASGYEELVAMVNYSHSFLYTLSNVIEVGAFMYFIYVYLIG